MAKKTIKSLLSKVKGTRYTFYNLDNSDKSRFRSAYNRLKKFGNKGETRTGKTYYIQSYWLKQFNNALKQKRTFKGFDGKKKTMLEMEYIRKMKAMEILDIHKTTRK